MCVCVFFLKIGFRLRFIQWLSEWTGDMDGKKTEKFERRKKDLQVVEKNRRGMKFKCFEAKSKNR